MVMLAIDNPTPTYRVFDERGTPVGKVILPTAGRVSGPGAATIYLRRELPVSLGASHPTQN